MHTLLPLFILTAIMLLHQRRLGRPSLLAYGAVAYLLSVTLFRVPWTF